MSGTGSISTHVLDLARGRPAGGVAVRLERRDPKDDARWAEVAAGQTDTDGRVALVAGATLATGTYRLAFELTPYFAAHGTSHFFPEASIVFEVRAAEERYHVPLLLSPHGYSTYRGS